MSLVVEWYGTMARFDADGGTLDRLAVPSRPGLVVVSAASPADGPVDLSFGFSPAGERWRLTGDSELAVTEGSLAELWDRAWQHLELQMAARSTDPVFIHAGAVAVDGVGIVFPGRSGRGKTTLALELCRAGATYFSDEYALIDTDGRLRPYARDPHVRPGTPFWSQDVRSRTDDRGARTAVGRGVLTPIARFTDRVGDGPVPLAGVVVAQYEEGARWSPAPLDARGCALALLDNAVGARTRTPAVMDAVGVVAASSWCVEGVRGEPSEVAEWVQNHL